MLDDYCHASPLESKPNSKNSANNGSQKQISLNKHKSKQEAHIELIMDNDPDFQEKERPKKLNFLPTQQPSINWNESPQKPLRNNLVNQSTITQTSVPILKPVTTTEN